jgi:membrane-associated phospholipid phosphatase
MTSDSFSHISFWLQLTRLGEMQLVLPAALLALLMLLRRPDTRTLAFWWGGLLVAATLLTTGSKIAFIGWGIGSAALDFTGISGHAMFASAVYPLLLGTLTSQASPAGQRWALAIGFILAFLVGVSRVLVGAHSSSEVIAGLLLGGGVSIAALTLAQRPRAVMGSTVTALTAAWFLIMPIQAPESPTHALVTRLSLSLAEKKLPFTRSELLQELRHP